MSVIRGTMQSLFLSRISAGILSAPTAFLVLSCSPSVMNSPSQIGSVNAISCACPFLALKYAFNLDFLVFLRVLCACLISHFLVFVF